MRFLSVLPLFMASVPALAQQPYPAVEILEAFRDGCGTIESQAAAAGSLTAAGWQPVPSSEETGPLGDFLTFSRQAGAQAAAAEGADIGKIEAFQNTIAGEQVYIVLDEVRAEGARVSGCQLYDFGETRPIALEVAGAWMKRQPTETLNRPEIQTVEWVPGVLPGHDSFKIFFVPNDSPAAQLVRFSGVALKSDTVGVE